MTLTLITQTIIFIAAVVEIILVAKSNLAKEWKTTITLSEVVIIGQAVCLILKELGR